MSDESRAWVEGEDYYVDENGLFVLTAKYLLRRGYCCHQGCRHCPYDQKDLPAEPKPGDKISE